MYPKPRDVEEAEPIGSASSFEMADSVSDSAYGWRLLLLPLLVLLLSLMLAYLCYIRGVTGPFVYDDGANISAVISQAPSAQYAQVEDALVVLLMSDSGAFGRPLALMTFFLQHLAGQDSTYDYKLANLIVHFINALLVYTFLLLCMETPNARRFYSRSYRAQIPGIVAGLWVLNPVHVTSVLYSIQRMTSLAGTFLLAATCLFLYSRLRAQSLPLRRWLVIASLLFALAGTYVKETTALFPFCIAVLEFTAFRSLLRLDPKSLPRRALATMFFVCAVLICLIFTNPELLYGYQFRPWGPCERLLTEGFVLWDYVQRILLPLPNRFSLFLDDIPVRSCSITSASAWLGWSLIGVAAVTFLASRPMTLLGLAWFLVGHSMESSILPLEIAFDHRNYIPSIGLFLVLTDTLLRWAEKHWLVAYAVLTLLLALSTWSLATLSSIWANPLDLATHMVSARPQSSSAHANLGRLLANAASLNPDNIPLRNSAIAHLDRSLVLNSSLFPSRFTKVMLLRHLGLDDSLAIQDLQSALNTNKLHHSLGAGLQSFSRGLPQSSYPAVIPVILNSFGNALGNPNLYPSLRRSVLIALADFHARLGDVLRAKSIIDEVLRETPGDLECLLRQVSYSQSLGNGKALLQAVQSFNNTINQSASAATRLVASRKLYLLLNPELLSKQGER